MGIDWNRSGVSKSDFVGELSEWIRDSIVKRNWPDKPDITHHLSIIKTPNEIKVFGRRFFNGEVMLREDGGCGLSFSLVKNYKVSDFLSLPVYHDSADNSRNFVATPYLQNVQSPVLATYPNINYAHNPIIRNVYSLIDVPNHILLSVLTHREVAEYCDMDKNAIYVLDEHSRVLLAERYKINITPKIFFSERFVNHMENREFKPRWVNINGCDIIAFWEHVGHKA